MNTENNFTQLYSELSLTPDLATLAERCKLLTEILLDCKSLPQTHPLAAVLRHIWMFSRLSQINRWLTSASLSFLISSRCLSQAFGFWRIQRHSATIVVP